MVLGPLNFNTFMLKVRRNPVLIQIKLQIIHCRLSRLMLTGMPESSPHRVDRFRVSIGRGSRVKQLKI